MSVLASQSWTKKHLGAFSSISFAALWLCFIASQCEAQVAGNTPAILNAQEQFFQSNGVSIRYLIAGHGEPVILVHGWSASAEMWPELMNDLAKDHLVIAMDCRGHGKSDKPHDSSQYGSEMSNDVVRLMDHLELQKVHVVGYSMGCGIVMRLLVDHPDRLLRDRA
jgi:alpha-beta hydrolase superfamily lysophospholipase